MNRELGGSPTNFHSEHPAESSYLRARAEWDDRIGTNVVAAKNWRYAFFLATLVSLSLLAILAFKLSQPAVAPFVIAVNEESGFTQVLGKVGRGGYVPNDLAIRYFLAQFIRQVRSVSQDHVLVRKNWLEAYEFLTTESSLKLNQLTKSDPDSPLNKLGTKFITVKPLSVVRVTTENSFQARWEESVFDARGALLERYTMIGLFTVAINVPREEKTLLVNPLGIYITSFEWTKEL